MNITRIAMLATIGLASCSGANPAPAESEDDTPVLPANADFYSDSVDDDESEFVETPTKPDLPPLATLSVPPPPNLSGTFDALTYNVAGLPAVINKGDPKRTIPLISPKLNAYDLVFAQEDFAYHSKLVSKAKHPFIEAPSTETLGLGDGLSVFSNFALNAHRHEKWNACNGYFSHKSDCLTAKGFFFGTITLAKGVKVDIYDLHADAGRSSGDKKARAKQVGQLVDWIRDHSSGRAILVAGDTNMAAEDEAQLQDLLKGAKLTDSCRSLGCKNPARYDRILYRSGGGVTLTAKSWKVDWTFVDANNAQLSDHEPVAVTFTWST